MDNTLFILLLTIITVSLVLMILMRRCKKRFTHGQQEFFRKHWSAIEQLGEKDPHHAIMNADKLIDKALEIKGYAGSLGEKLKKSGRLFGDVQGLWKAHKMRNTLAHEIGYELTRAQTVSSLRAFKKALRDLGLKL